MATIKAPRGTRDLLPPDTSLWNHIDTVARSVFARHGFGEIRTPVFEATELFARGVGEETDIVSKEMFTWEDGERFNERKMIDAWTYVNQFSMDVIRKEIALPSLPGPKVDLVVAWKNMPVVAVIDFKQKASIEAVLRLEAVCKELETSGQLDLEGRRLIGQLVVPAGATQLPDTFKRNSAIQVVEFPGQFNDSVQNLCLRPENTAGVVRAYIEHKLGETGNLQKLYYIGPQFRRERPQKGRYRQFFQIGAEVIGPPSSGSESPVRDAEILVMLAAFLNELGIKDWKLMINSVGSSSDRPRYLAALREALAPIKDKMSPDNQRRAETNPLRVLDSKDEGDQEMIDNLPKIADYLDESSKQHFAQVLAALDACGVPYTVNPRLVRGLDYYTRTTFEFVAETGLGTQNALLGGGRYDGLSEMLGGPKAPGIGFAIGQDRLVLTLQAQMEAEAAAGKVAVATKLDTYIAPMGEAQNPAALALAQELRGQGFGVEVGDGSFRLKKSFDAADRVARTIVILGEDEVANHMVTLKTFATGEQVKIARAELKQILEA